METAVKTAKRQRIQGSDACVMMHAALRKVCDSKITSSVYNMVHLIGVKPDEFDPWRFFGQLVADQLNLHVKKPVEALKTAHTEFEDKVLNALHEAKTKGVEPPAEARTWLYALSCAMACFSANDWAGMAAYLGEE